MFRFGIWVGVRVRVSGARFPEVQVQDPLVRLLRHAPRKGVPRHCRQLGVGAQSRRPRAAHVEFRGQSLHLRTENVCPLREPCYRVMAYLWVAVRARISVEA